MSALLLFFFFFFPVKGLCLWVVCGCGLCVCAWHAVAPVAGALKLGAPASVEASSTRVNEETYPLASMVTYQFPARRTEVQSINSHVRGLEGAAGGGIEMPPLKLVWYDGGMRPPRPEQLEDGRTMGATGALLLGDRGKILSEAGRRYRIIPEAKAKEYGDPPQKLPRSIGHYKEWIEAAKGGKPGGANFD